MSASNENFSTPVQTKGSRRLGLRRNNSSIGKAVSAVDTSKEAGCSVKTRNGMTTIRMQPQSDAKVNYRNGEDCNKKNDSKYLACTPETPNTSCLVQRQSVSTSCRPYRLSLSKRVREKMTKKRLEFHIANEMEKEDEERKLNQQHENEYNNGARLVSEEDACCRVSAPIETIAISKSAGADKVPEEMPLDELLAVIEQSRKEWKAREKHAFKAQDLQQTIEIWTNGFSTALSDLQQKILPPVDKETLLEQLRIPREMIKYVND